MKFNKLWYIYIISFIEGGMMLVTEFASTRKISVFFGNSLYVWLIVLCITMIGLAAGYYIANYWISRSSSNIQLQQKQLSSLFLILSISLMCWKFNNNVSMFLIHAQVNLISAVIIDALFLLLFPMFAYGSITTLLVSISQKINPDQPVYGKILAYSTLGSIVFAVMAVLFLFPLIGVQLTIIILSLLALIISVMTYKLHFSSVLILLILFIYPEKKIRQDVLYQNDGVFSSVMVIDDTRMRYLLVNYIIQTFITHKDGKTLKYAEWIDSIAYTRNWKQKDILILGLGGGVLANKLSRYSRTITGVEIDPRIIYCAKKYFQLNPKLHTISADAQWFIYQTTHKYDVIIMDVFNGEEPPAYLLTKENFNHIKKLFRNDSALLIINWHGYYSGKRGMGTKVLINTLQKSHFNVSVISTHPSEDVGNLVIWASFHSSLIPASHVNILIDEHTGVNLADKNILSVLNAEANYEWRKGYLKFIEYWWK